MNAEQITSLLSARDIWLCVRDECVNWEAVAAIESVLRDVPPGVDDRVDLALGRTCAVLPPRVEYNISREVSAADIDEMEARTAETATEPPTHDGMWM